VTPTLCGGPEPGTPRRLNGHKNTWGSEGEAWSRRGFRLWGLLGPAVTGFEAKHGEHGLCAIGEAVCFRIWLHLVCP